MKSNDSLFSAADNYNHILKGTKWMEIIICSNNNPIHLTN